MHYSKSGPDRKSSSKKITVLIVDNSAIMRKFFTDVLSSSLKIEVAGTAIDLDLAVHKINKFSPDLLVLDIKVLHLNGFESFTKIMTSHPMPVIMVSDNTSDSARETIKSLELGAADFMLKPTYEDIKSMKSLQSFTREFIDKIKAAAKSRVKWEVPHSIILPEASPERAGGLSRSVIAIGASAGGVKVIPEIFSRLPEDIPGIVVVQHMPAEFTKAFAESTDKTSAIHVKEAGDFDRIYKGTALIAPGDKHVILDKDKEGFFVRLDDGEPFNRHKPSVDILFYSAAETAGKKAHGILLTGMGSDGAKGLLEMKGNGAVTIAQDRESSIVFGMPMAAIDIGAAKMVKNTEAITAYIAGIREGRR